MHQLEREITLNVNTTELWNFIATPSNLNQLTPPNLDFKILSNPPERMHNGLMILYDIAIPLFGRQRWLTEIKHIREHQSFVDEQRLGPYLFWYHYHEITPVDSNRTRMLDRVHYALPFGILGQLVHRFRVRKMLEDIFTYRTARLHDLFP